MTRTIGFLLYDDVELLDFAGPFEVFLTARRLAERDQPGRAPIFELCTLARQPSIRFRGGVIAQVDQTLEVSRQIDVLVVPGGVVTQALECVATLHWLQQAASRAEYVLSVCTGAFLLARAGLLGGKRTTTHWEDLEDLRREAADAEVMEGVRFVADGSLICAAGISAGLDAALYCLSRLIDFQLAMRTARQMEYIWDRSVDEFGRKAT